MPHENKSGPAGFISEALGIFLDKRATRSAASFAYFMTLSVFPLIICVNYFVAALRLSPAFIMDAVGPFVPSDALSIVADYLGYISTRQSLSLALAGLATLLTASSGAFRSLARGIEDIHERRRFHGAAGFFVGFLFSIVFLLVIYIGICIVVTGEWFIALLDRVTGVGGLIGSWLWLRFLLLPAMLLLTINAAYSLATPRPESFARPVTLPGAATAAAVLSLVSMVFSYFIGLSSKYSLIYGSLASLIIMMLWLYIIGNIIIAGGVINRVIALRRERNGQG